MTRKVLIVGDGTDSRIVQALMRAMKSEVAEGAGANIFPLFNVEKSPYVSLRRDGETFKGKHVAQWKTEQKFRK